MNTLQRLEKKLDSQALSQLREIAAHLYDELEKTKIELQKSSARLERAELIAEFWHEQAMHIDAQRSITKSCDITH